MRVIAALNGSAVSATVQAAAEALAALLQAEVQPLHVERGPVAPALREAASAADVAALVIGARTAAEDPRPAGHVAAELMTSLRGPLVVVPPAPRAARELRRLLVALDGSPEAAAALAPVCRAACAGGAEVVVVHVFDPRAAPAFSDQPHHWTEAFAQEFRARHVAEAGAAIALRAGDPPTSLLDAATELDADLVALAWSQVRQPGRAAVVERAVAAGHLPVLLVPVVRDDAPASGP